MDAATRDWLLDQLGKDTNLADLEARYARLGKARAVALTVLQQRWNDLVAQPTVIGVSSVVSLNTTANLAALERKMAELQADGAPPAPDEPADTGTSGDDRFGIIQLVERPRR
ncbi:hypothetical protein ACFW81_23615 [Streptomyces angustmyceticus]|uniref:hypothetical protein n=1 Tax=Streptomyces angustmyceticus TaxID=285578 RepID=UPI00367EAC8B